MNVISEFNSAIFQSTIKLYYGQIKPAKSMSEDHYYRTNLEHEVPAFLSARTELQNLMSEFHYAKTNLATYLFIEHKWFMPRGSKLLARGLAPSD